MTGPALPTLRALTRMLRDTHAAYTHPDAGGEFVALILHEDGQDWRVEPECYAADKAQSGCVFGREYIPGDECPCAKCFPTEANEPTCCETGHPCTFDATAAARRLLAAAREAGFR